MRDRTACPTISITHNTARVRTHKLNENSDVASDVRQSAQKGIHPISSAAAKCGKAERECDWRPRKDRNRHDAYEKYRKIPLTECAHLGPDRIRGAIAGSLGGKT